MKGQKVIASFGRLEMLRDVEDRPGFCAFQLGRPGPGVSWSTGVEVYLPANFPASYAMDVLGCRRGSKMVQVCDRSSQT